MLHWPLEKPDIGYITVPLEPAPDLTAAPDCSLEWLIDGGPDVEPFMPLLLACA